MAHAYGHGMDEEKQYYKESGHWQAPAGKDIMKAMKDILKWQYDQLIKELLLLQEHLSNPSCPCETAGEHCIRKHLYAIEAYAEETIPMESNDEYKLKMEELAIQAESNRRMEEQALCGKGKTVRIADWARDWRKNLENYSLACENIRVAQQGDPLLHNEERTDRSA